MITSHPSIESHITQTWKCYFRRCPYLGLYGLPERGVYPKELLDIGIRDYREVFFKPCRIIYRLQGEREAEIDDKT